ncbi:MAG: hypothetical protein FJ381_06865 [Verrucomicrobia bacterium]|nr:hypothetical protein [Verrucomicrobiota bacterium]
MARISGSRVFPGPPPLRPTPTPHRDEPPPAARPRCHAPPACPPCRPDLRAQVGGQGGQGARQVRRRPVV